jgi:hypothetical protein
MIENNVFKKYIEKKQRCEIEMLNIHYVDTDDLLSNYDIIT